MALSQEEHDLLVELVNRVRSLEAVVETFSREFLLTSRDDSFGTDINGKELSFRRAVNLQFQREAQA